MPAQRTLVVAAALGLLALLAPPAWAGQAADDLVASIDRVVEAQDHAGHRTDSSGCLTL